MSGVGDFLGSNTGQGLLNLGAGYLQNEQNQQAANQYAQAQIEAAKIAAEAARFKPVGVTTRFGQSQFGYDDKGNVVSAGYTLSPEMKAQQDALMGAITGNRQGMMQPNSKLVQIAGARAFGGPVTGGQTYLVGENGPELFTAPTSGGIVPNQLGNQMAYAGGTPGFYQNAPSSQSAMNSVLQNLVPNNQRATGGFFGSTNAGMQYAGGTPGFYQGGANTGANISLPPQQQSQQPQQYTQQNAGLIGQATNEQQTTRPLAQGSQSLFNLGRGYLSTSPEDQAAKFMQQQQALLEPSRERAFAQLQNQKRKP